MTSRPIKASLITLWVVALLLAACQVNTDLPAATSQSTSTARTPEPERGDPEKEIAPTFTPTPQPTPTLPAHLRLDPAEVRGREITFWHPWQDQVAEEAGALVDEFNRSNEWGVRVRMEPYYSLGALNDAVEAGLSDPAGALPQVVATSPETILAWATEYHLAVDLQEYFAYPHAGWSQAEIDAFDPVFWEQDQHEGRQLGIPVLRTGNVLFYNQSWARDLGFDSAPATPEEFERQVCAAAKENNGSGELDRMGTGGWLVDTDALTLLSWLAAFDADIAPDGADGEYTFQSDEAEEALAYLRGMLDSGCAWLIRSQTAQAYFADRKALFYTGNLQEMYIQKQVSERAGSQDEWTVLPFVSVSGTPLVYVNGYSYAVLRGKGEPDMQGQLASWLFVRWMAQPANLAKLAEALPSFPVSSAVDAQLMDYQAHFPWASIVPLRQYARETPAVPGWRIVRRLVEDAAWQVFHLPAEQVELVLPQLDETTQELLDRSQ